MAQELRDEDCESTYKKPHAKPNNPPSLPIFCTTNPNYQCSIGAKLPSFPVTQAAKLRSTFLILTASWLFAVGCVLATAVDKFAETQILQNHVLDHQYLPGTFHAPDLEQFSPDLWHKFLKKHGERIINFTYVKHHGLIQYSTGIYSSAEMRSGFLIFCGTCEQVETHRQGVSRPIQPDALDIWQAQLTNSTDVLSRRESIKNTWSHHKK